MHLCSLWSCEGRSQEVFWEKSGRNDEWSVGNKRVLGEEKHYSGIGKTLYCTKIRNCNDCNRAGLQTPNGEESIFCGEDVANSKTRFLLKSHTFPRRSHDSTGRISWPNWGWRVVGKRSKTWRMIIGDTSERFQFHAVFGVFSRETPQKQAVSGSLYLIYSSNLNGK